VPGTTGRVLGESATFPPLERSERNTALFQYYAAAAALLNVTVTADRRGGAAGAQGPPWRRCAAPSPRAGGASHDGQRRPPPATASAAPQILRSPLRTRPRCAPWARWGTLRTPQRSTWCCRPFCSARRRGTLCCASPRPLRQPPPARGARRSAQAGSRTRFWRWPSSGWEPRATRRLNEHLEGNFFPDPPPVGFVFCLN